MRRIHCAVSMAGWEPGSEVVLPPEAGHYASRVLRLKTGTRIELFDGLEQSWEGLLEVVGEECRVRLLEKLEGDPVQAQALPVLLLMAHPRGKKLDLVLQKSTELGAVAIWVVPTERAVPRPDADRLEGRLERWSRIVTEAARQCGRRRPPEVLAPVSLERALSELPSWASARWACAVDSDQPTLAGHLREEQRASGAVLAVGPEGGFTPDELEMLKSHGFLALGLGPRVLRTETAPLVGLTLAQSLWGDLR